MRGAVLGLLVVLALLVAPASAASIENVARIEQKGRTYYEGFVFVLGFNMTFKYYAKFINYTEVSPGLYNLTFESDLFAMGSRNNETITVTRNYTGYARLSKDPTGSEIPFFDNQRANEAIEYVKNYASSEYGIALQEEHTTRTVKGKSFEAVKLSYSNETYTLEIVLAINVGIALYLYEDNENANTTTKVELEDTNLTEPSGVSGKLSRTAIIAISIIVIVAVLAAIFLLRRKAVA